MKLYKLKTPKRDPRKTELRKKQKELMEEIKKQFIAGKDIKTDELLFLAEYYKLRIGGQTRSILTTHIERINGRGEFQLKPPEQIKRLNRFFGSIQLAQNLYLILLEKEIKRLRKEIKVLQSGPD